MKICSFKRPRCLFFLLALIVLANLSAFVDLYRHPEIPYFDMEHIIVGSITAFIGVLLILSLNIQNSKLEKIIAKHESLKEDFNESELKFQVLTAKSPDMIHLNNDKGELLFANPVTEVLLGYTPEELIGKSIGGLIHPEHKNLIKDDMRILFSQNSPPPLREIKILKKDGTYLPVEVHGFIVDMGNTKKYMGAILRDISERIENEKKIHAIQGWANTFDSMEEIISVHDKNFKIVRVNKAFCDFTGKPREELLGKYCYEEIHGTGQQWHNCPHERTLTSLKTEKNEVVDPASGITFQVTCSPLLDKKQEVIGSVHTMRDISTVQETDNKKVLFPLCSNCKKIRDNKDEWQTMEEYFLKDFSLKFTHSICPDCVQELYPELYGEDKA
jgi:PAS domain S-box-containing protein